MCEAVVDGSCVAVVPRKLSWHDARSNCEQKGGRLVEIYSHATHNVIAAIAIGTGLCGHIIADVVNNFDFGVMI